MVTPFACEVNGVPGTLLAVGDIEGVVGRIESAETACVLHTHCKYVASGLDEAAWDSIVTTVYDAIHGAYLLAVEERDVVVINAAQMDVEVFADIFRRHIDNTAKPEEPVYAEDVLGFACHATLIAYLTPCGVIEGW